MAADEEVQLLGLEDSYDQIILLAVGGMAEVYRGRQKTLDRPVAIKRIRPELRSNKDVRERFRREARISGNLLHQNLAHVYDYRTVGDEAYIIMEYIDGFDLSQLIHRTGLLPIDVATMAAIKMLHGLSYIHAHGMVHRDLKPDNVRVSTRGEIKIMDFGIAYDPVESTLTTPGILIGSPHYLAPEQIMGAKLDQRVDLFSFGISFYEMLTGKRPFYETQKETVYMRIQKGEYINPMAIRHDLPSFFDQIISSCLEVNLERRASSAMRVASSLSEYLARHYTLAYEARIRQFLFQSGTLLGNPDLVEVSEKTLSEPPFSLLQRLNVHVDALMEKVSEWAEVLKVLAAFIVIGAGVALWWHQQHTTVSKSVPDAKTVTAPTDAQLKKNSKHSAKRPASN